jgi:uncharacterized protein (TIGR00255 family)
MKSMTGYGEAAAQGRWARVVAQLRTVNNRSLDLQPRLPREYLALEEEIRKRVRERISRGRVDLFVTRSLLRGHNRTIELDEALLRQYLQSFRRAQRKFGLKGQVDISLCASLPELFRVREGDPSGDDEAPLVFKALSGALANLERSRRREGRQLQLDILGQVRQLRGVSAALTKEAGEIETRNKQALALRATAQPGATSTFNGAPENESWSFKGDIHEEVVRLETHVKELGRLARSREPVGKRVEFLLQEILRELNTVASKAPQMAAVQWVVAGKERVEQIREQAHNIE